MPRTPTELAQLALAMDELVRRHHIPVSERFVDFANSEVILDQVYRAEGHIPRQPPSFVVLEYQYARWVKAGLSTVRLTEGLAAALALTSPDDMPFDSWRWPFNCFLIHIPYDFWFINGPWGKDPVAMILVNKTTSGNGTPMGQQIMFGRGGANAFSQVPLYGVETIGEWLEQTAEINRDKTSISDTFELDENDQQNMNEGWKLIVNTCLYMTEHRGERVVAHTTKSVRRRAEKRGGSLPRGPEVWVLGKEVKLDRDVIVAAKSHGIGGPAWRVKAQFVVRGHWRDQAYGPGYSLRRPKFIAPHWKGPKEGERFAHLYDPNDDE
jgi:hypothetical protein